MPLILVLLLILILRKAFPVLFMIKVPPSASPLSVCTVTPVATFPNATVPLLGLSEQATVSITDSVNTPSAEVAAPVILIKPESRREYVVPAESRKTKSAK